MDKTIITDNGEKALVLNEYKIGSMTEEQFAEFKKHNNIDDNTIEEFKNANPDLEKIYKYLKPEVNIEPLIDYKIINKGDEGDEVHGGTRRRRRNNKKSKRKSKNNRKKTNRRR